MEKFKKSILKVVKNRYFIQRLTGIALLLLSFLICNTDIMLDLETGKKDVTALLLLIPLGLSLLFSKDLMME